MRAIIIAAAIAAFIMGGVAAIAYLIKWAVNNGMDWLPLALMILVIFIFLTAVIYKVNKENE